jgi:prolyl-tRNA synthetase
LAVAPLPVHLLTLGKGDEVQEAADQLYTQLVEAGIEVLYDNRRDESAGVKFNDADLIGLPLRLTVGARGLKEGVAEAKWRTADERETIPLAEVISEVVARLESSKAG